MTEQHDRLLDHPVLCGGSPQALGLAVAIARTGARVTLLEENPSDVQRARDLLVRAGAETGIVVTNDPGAARGATVLIAASDSAGPCPLAPLRPIASPDALVARMGGDVSVADDVLTMETIAPPPDPGLIELHATASTDRATLDRARHFAKVLGVPSITTPRPIAAALIATIEDCAEDLIFDGSTPWDVDTALESVGFGLGPCAAQDLRGLDRAYARHRAEDARGHRALPLPVLDRMVPEGRLGRKGGVGWYRYPGGGGRVIDPLVEDLAREEAHFARHPTRDILPAEIIARVREALRRAALDLSRDVPRPTIIQIAAIALDCATIGPLLFPEDPA
ncbi:MAG: 3-hydroxyacyl-CoA dehydrogenase family protein [Paracoccaceae bacterium]